MFIIKYWRCVISKSVSKWKYKCFFRAAKSIRLWIRWNHVLMRPTKTRQDCKVFFHTAMFDSMFDYTPLKAIHGYQFCRKQRIHVHNPTKILIFFKSYTRHNLHTTIHGKWLSRFYTLNMCGAIHSSAYNIPSKDVEYRNQNERRFWSCLWIQIIRRLPSLLNDAWRRVSDWIATRRKETYVVPRSKTQDVFRGKFAASKRAYKGVAQWNIVWRNESAVTPVLRRDSKSHVALLRH